MARRHPPEARVEARRLREGGASVTAIAELGISSSTVPPGRQTLVSSSAGARRAACVWRIALTFVTERSTCGSGG